jgi:DNA (cytosine-5)-methyltransferase 1
MREGETGAKALLRNETLEAPYDRTTFKDRYTKQHRDRLCSTIVAHLSKDGLNFIHPTQNRSLTPREAARIQSFPDTFLFPVSRTQQFTLIGNAVPPLLGKAVGLGISAWLEQVGQSAFDYDVQPIDFQQAIKWMTQLVTNYKNGNLATTPQEVFIKGWKGICFLFYDLHPDSIVENGKTIISDPQNADSNNIRPANEYSWPIYEKSGWPVKLVPYAREARKRYLQNKIKYDDYYCYSAMRRGYFQVKGRGNG